MKESDSSKPRRLNATDVTHRAPVPLPSIAKDKNEMDNDGAFLCNICLDPVKDKDPVVTQCGHLYCWPCLYQWLNTTHSTCPVCKAGVTVENVIPIFIKDSNEDPRKKHGSPKIPGRPAARRPEPVVGQLVNINGNAMSTGTNYFPSLFGLLFQNTPLSDPPTIAELVEEKKAGYLKWWLYGAVVVVVLAAIFI